MTVQQFFLTPASHSVYVNKQSAVVLSPDIALNIDYDYELERIVVRLADSEWSHIFTADRLNINERLIHTSLLSSEVTLDTNNDYINKVFLTIDNEIIEFNFAKRIGQNFVKIIQNSHYAYLNSEQAYIYSDLCCCAMAMKSICLFNQNQVLYATTIWIFFTQNTKQIQGFILSPKKLLRTKQMFWSPWLTLTRTMFAQQHNLMSTMKTQTIIFSTISLHRFNISMMNKSY